MKPDEAKEILTAFRPGTTDEDDPFFDEALKAAATDPELGRWFAAEQAFDAALNGKLQSARPAPERLREKLKEIVPSKPPFRWTAPSILTLAGGATLAALVLSIILIWQEASPSIPGGLVAHFREEMVSFVRLPPPLDLAATETAPLVAWMREAGGPVPVIWPDGVQRLPAVGCRTFVFNGRKVALFCFQRADGQLVHLFVADRDVFSGTALPARPAMEEAGGFASALWAANDRVYLLATAGPIEQINRLL